MKKKQKLKSRFMNYRNSELPVNSIVKIDTWYAMMRKAVFTNGDYLSALQSNLDYIIHLSADERKTGYHEFHTNST